jgi:c-di-GMP-binding flagellar brake protein YcgR
MFENGDQEEKREMRKIERRYLVFYLRVFDGLSSNILGHLVDISEKGIMLLSDNPVEINEDYRLRMRLPTEMKDRNEIIFTATSRWCKSDSNPDFYRTGFQMHNLKPYAKRLISRLIDDFGYGN